VLLNKGGPARLTAVQLGIREPARRPTEDRHVREAAVNAFTTFSDVLSKCIFVDIPLSVPGIGRVVLHVPHRKLTTGLKVLRRHFDAQLVMRKVPAEDGEVIDEMLHLGRVEGAVLEAVHGFLLTGQLDRPINTPY
jgi:hypothetical protein